ncbi:TIR (Toll-Interleukin 1-resistance) domain containing protein-like protein [Acidithiobacillus ferrooxidans ATCC 53993]|uniref:toll/interleukin-1 receptor domain-containing protein n=1 Tax=Acidithiobacillus ferrooxidans TaxID=920 RepID=UPI00017F6D8E|nr:TIR domain-containing protein [Acidithiobacillus ferrooxidans]ACH82512.1 TIR (Toll-Interleukin 1-resistance) domain containing protein-like protein [Acidithiobacillus ferrooxidans ATCC 53993]MBU2807734.1 TIR domain-containing protein [Acidithiobacillus ferrooxidans F221]
MTSSDQYQSFMIGVIGDDNGRVILQLGMLRCSVSAIEFTLFLKELALYKYDFGLSFAGEDREYPEKLARLLKDEHVRVFYDREEEADLWGQDLYQGFQKVYGQECRFFIPFVSANYIVKRWPRHELKQAQARDFKSNVEYILPLRLDDTELPGINDTTAYIDLRDRSIEDVAQLCLGKLVRDSAIRQLFIFLRENNPASIKLLDSRPATLLIRVATSKASSFERIFAQIAPQVCRCTDHHNTFINGGYGPAGCIPSVDAEPHTTFFLILSENFYAEIMI